MGIKIPMTAELADGRTLKATVDQRDLAKAEAQEIDPGAKHTWVRFLAWSALSRMKQYTGTWGQFNEDDCIEASDMPEESTDTERLDPGQPGASAGA